jgi:hypothetical protein
MSDTSVEMKCSLGGELTIFDIVFALKNASGALLPWLRFSLLMSWMSVEGS